jgi:hypothetical protein
VPAAGAWASTAPAGKQINEAAAKAIREIFFI